MRMALGFLLLFGGAMLGYAVLSGKFPNTNASAPSSPLPSQPASAPVQQTVKKLTSLNGGGNNVLGIPTLTSLSGDTHATHGGF